MELAVIEVPVSSWGLSLGRLGDGHLGIKSESVNRYDSLQQGNLYGKIQPFEPFVRNGGFSTIRGSL